MRWLLIEEDAYIGTDNKMNISGGLHHHLILMIILPDLYFHLFGLSSPLLSLFTLCRLVISLSPQLYILMNQDSLGSKTLPHHSFTAAILMPTPVIRLNISQHKENNSIFLSQALIFFHGKRGIILVKQVSQIMSLIKTVYFYNPIFKLIKYKARNVQKSDKQNNIFEFCSVKAS